MENKNTNTWFYIGVVAVLLFNTMVMVQMSARVNHSLEENRGMFDKQIEINAMALEMHQNQKEVSDEVLKRAGDIGEFRNIIELAAQNICNLKY